MDTSEENEIFSDHVSRREVKGFKEDKISTS